MFHHQETDAYRLAPCPLLALPALRPAADPDAAGRADAGAGPDEKPAACAVAASYPAYRRFFFDPFGPTALIFWTHYPSPVHLAGFTVADLAAFLREHSHYALGRRQAAVMGDDQGGREETSP